MTTYSPAVERATDSLRDAYQGGGSWLEIGQAALTAALTDPTDPDSLARTLYVLHMGVKGLATPETALMWWLEIPEFERSDWRGVADGLRMMLTGQGSP